MRKSYYFLVFLLLLSGQSLAGRAQESAALFSPMPASRCRGATVFIRGTSIGTSTNRDGSFSLRADFSNGPVTLAVSFVGYITREVTLSQPDKTIRLGFKPNPIQTTEMIASAPAKRKTCSRLP